ncbi:MAG: hypothetical protein MUE71_05345, partial [Chitinophagaceae bacterium]|nr:hypothetical protein [Chitinophagaceae bacterium]
TSAKSAGTNTNFHFIILSPQIARISADDCFFPLCGDVTKICAYLQNLREQNSNYHFIRLSPQIARISADDGCFPLCGVPDVTNNMVISVNKNHSPFRHPDKVTFDKQNESNF